MAGGARAIHSFFLDLTGLHERTCVPFSVTSSRITGKSRALSVHLERVIHWPSGGEETESEFLRPTPPRSKPPFFSVNI